MKQTPKEQQNKGTQSERKEQKIGTSLQEIIEDMRKHKKRKYVDGCEESDYNDDDSDCYCE